MGYLIATLWPSMALAALIGLATGAWMWRARAGAQEAAEEAPAAPELPPPPPEPSPFLAVPEGVPDDLTRIKGVGPKLHELLRGIGVHHFRQIAGWSDAQVAEVDSHLGGFKGRITRDRWVEQARFLEAGDVEGFEREFGNINTQG